jgi:hypothetical protein
VSSEPTAPAQQKVIYGLDGGIATITLNDPDTRNALSPQLLGDLIDAFERARDDDQVHCVVLASSHEKTFSSGANLDGFAAEEALVHKHFGSERFVGLFKLIGALGKPTICAVRGHVLAGALGIALACDLIVASEEATFGTPEINIGTFPFMIMALIYRNVPRKRPTSCCCWASAGRRGRRLRRESSTGYFRTASSTRPCGNGRPSSPQSRPSSCAWARRRCAANWTCLWMTRWTTCARS